MEGNMSNFWGESTDDFVVHTTELGSTVGATAGFILTVSGVIGTGPLLPLLLICSVAMTVLKGMHVAGLQKRKQEKEEDTTNKKIMEAVQNKEIFTGAAFGITTVGASFLTTHPAVTVSAASSVLYPAQSVIALGFAINALVELYDNVCQWQELRALEASNNPKVYGEYEQSSKATGKLALSSLVKFLGWCAVMTGSFTFALPLATLLVSGGLALVAGSHFYNNFFAIPRIIVKEEKDGDFITRVNNSVNNNSARIGNGWWGNTMPKLLRGLQVI